MKPILRSLSSYTSFLAVAALLDKGADVNSTDSIGCTALHHSIYSGSLLSMALLLSSGANLNLRDDEGLTPLEAAECCGRQEAIEPLKKAVLKVSISEGCLSQRLRLGLENEAKHSTLCSPMKFYLFGCFLNPFITLFLVCFPVRVSAGKAA